MEKKMSEQKKPTRLNSIALSIVEIGSTLFRGEKPHGEEEDQHGVVENFGIGANYCGYGNLKEEPPRVL